MTANLQRLTDTKIAREQREYSHDEKEAAFLLWRTSAGRSLRKVATATGIAERTLYYWRDHQDWIARANQEDTEDYASSRIGVAAVVVNHLVPSILRAVAIRDDPNVDPRVQLDAAKWLAGLAGVSPVSKIETSVVQAPKAADIVDVQSLASLSPDELMKLEQQTRAKRQSS